MMIFNLARPHLIISSYIAAYRFTFDVAVDDANMMTRTNTYPTTDRQTAPSRKRRPPDGGRGWPRPLHQTPPDDDGDGERLPPLLPSSVGDDELDGHSLFGGDAAVAGAVDDYYDYDDYDDGWQIRDHRKWRHYASWWMRCRHCAHVTGGRRGAAVGDAGVADDDDDDVEHGWRRHEPLRQRSESRPRHDGDGREHGGAGDGQRRKRRPWATLVWPQSRRLTSWPPLSDGRSYFLVTYN